MRASMFGIIPDLWLTHTATPKIATALTLAAVVVVALRLGYRHKREHAEKAELDNRNRSLFKLGTPDQAGDRTAELIEELRQHESHRVMQASGGVISAP